VGVANNRIDRSSQNFTAWAEEEEKKEEEEIEVMGKLSRMPSVEIISKFAGLVDFYFWKGIVCFRKWPRRRKVTTARWRATNTKFTGCVLAYNQLTDQERALWRERATGTGVSGRDAFMSDCLKSP